MNPDAEFDAFFGGGAQPIGMTEDSQQANSALQRMAQEMERMSLQNTELQRRLHELAGQASNSHSALEQRLGDAERRAHEAEQATRGSRKGSANLKPVRPQRFRGGLDGPRILDWLHQAEQYVRAAGVEDEEQGIWHITSFLESDAAIWWRLYVKQAQRGQVKLPRKWSELRTLMEDTFREINHETDVRDRYIALKQGGGTVAQYITKFRAAIVELPEETKSSRIYWFLRGLRAEIQAATRTHKPHTLLEAMDVADEADRANHRAFKGPAKHSYATSGPSPMQVGAVETMEIAAVDRSDNMRLRQENRCFNCRRVGHQSRQCPRLQWNKSSGQGIREERDRPDGDSKRSGRKAKVRGAKKSTPAGYRRKSIN